MLNAHPNMVIAHEAHVPNLMSAPMSRRALYASIVHESHIFQSRDNKGIYSFAIPNQWQGRFHSLKIIGDKRGGAVTRKLAEEPDFLKKLRELTRCPLHLIHAIRNPYDNISAISTFQDLTLEESIDFYFAHCATTRRLNDYCEKSEILSVYHEDMIEDPRRELLRLCDYLDVQPTEDYLRDATSIVFPAATYTRRKLAWSDAHIEKVAQEMKGISFLDRYSFDDDH
tara:strand:+ start:294 stop:974 length:681 start_codon:yes stop_codon:yes gene_type:complete